MFTAKKGSGNFPGQSQENIENKYDLCELRKYRSAFWKIACHYDIPLFTCSLTNPNLKYDRYITLYK